MGRIAVVDDARAVLQLIESILTQAKHQVTTFQDATDVERLIASQQPDLVLLDVVMPGRNGYEVLRSLKRGEQTRAIPVVLVTSKNEPHDRAWGQRQGADGYLGKPFTVESLLSEVKRFVG